MGRIWKKRTGRRRRKVGQEVKGSRGVKRERRGEITMKDKKNRRGLVCEDGTYNDMSV